MGCERTGSDCDAGSENSFIQRLWTHVVSTDPYSLRHSTLQTEEVGRHTDPEGSWGHGSVSEVAEVGSSGFGVVSVLSGLGVGFRFVGV